MITVQNLSKQYVDQTIFDNVTFSLGPRDRVGLVGRNGHGKTTLFRLLTGEEQQDDGTITIPKGYRIGLLSQHINFTKPTLLEEGCCGLPDNQKTDEWKVEKMLSGLGFQESDFGRSPSEFSGGFQMRLNLAKVLVSDPNLLLLDEPTNFLDIVSIRWLVSFLNSCRNELIVISHDRGFMDSVATHTMGIHRSKLRKVKGTTQNFYDQISKEEEVHEKRRLNEEKKRKQAERFINSFRAKARHASLVQSRIKTLEKQEKLDKLEKIPTLSFSFNEAPFQAKHMQEARGTSFSYDGKQPYLIDKLNFIVEKNDRICIVGKNGKGKTTLLKLLAGVFQPLEGEVRNHPQSKKGYFEQSNTVHLNEKLTVEEEIYSCNTRLDGKKVRDICGAMMFSGDTALKKIKILSGGEKCRVLLGKILASPVNLLLLDEPTHHLDMQSCEAMMDAIGSFNGAVVMVTHSEYILKRIANKLIVFHHDKVFLFNGGYSQFLDQIGWDDTGNITQSNDHTEQSSKPVNISTKKLSRKDRAEFIKRRSETLTPYKKKIKDIEKTIGKLEQQLFLDNEALIKASMENDGGTITKLSKSLKHTQTQIDDLYEQLEKTTDKYEQEKLVFEQG